MLARQTSLSGNVILLCRFLRTRGFGITSTEEQDVMNALLYLPPKTEEGYVSVLQCCLCKTQFQYRAFPDLYKEYKFEVERAIDSKTKNLPERERKSKKPKAPSIEALKDWLYNKSSTDETDLASYSNVEVLVKKDFSMLSDDELDLIFRLLQKMAMKVLRRKSRLIKISKKHKCPDLAMTIRKNLRKTSDINEIVYSKKKEKKLKLVLLCDVSKSMDIYSRFFIQMIYAFQSGYDRVETFVFSTALHNISEILENHSFNQAFDIISERVPQWSGGTKIGYCLKSFCNIYAHTMIDRKTVVMILSDGWDTGDQTDLRESIKKIYKSSRKLIWLNPLAGHPKFQPEVTGLKTVQPYIHKLHAAHNLESLRSLMHLL